MKQKLRIGAGQKFEKIADAVKYIARMERSEDERVTVVLTDDLYREQVIVDTPNITIKSAKESGFNNHMVLWRWILLL